MRTLDCFSGIGAEIAAAMTVLKALSPRSSVVSWWNRTGQYAHFSVVPETIPSEDLEVLCDNMSYVRAVLQDAIHSEDVEDIAYVVTRLVSDIEDIQARV